MINHSQYQVTSRNLNSQLQTIHQHIQQPHCQFSMSYSLFLDYFKCILVFLSFATTISLFIFYCTSAIYYQKNQKYNSKAFEELLLTTTILTIQTNLNQCYNLSKNTDFSSIVNSSTNKIIFQPSLTSYDYDHIDLNQLALSHSNESTICIQYKYFQVTILDYSFSNHQIKSIYMILDGIIIGFSIVLIIAILYRDHRIHVIEYRPQIQKYSCEISNLPMLPKYILLPKLKQFIQNMVKEKYAVLIRSTQQEDYGLDFFQIFDIESSFTQKQIEYYYLLQKYNQLILSQKYSDIFKTESNTTQLKEIKLKLHQAYTFITSNHDSNTQIVWLTFSSRKSYFYFKQTFKYNLLSWGITQCSKLINKCEIKVFEGKAIQIKQAPQPLEINWKNIYVRPIRRYCTRFGIYIMCGVLILTFNMVIILTYRNLNRYESAILILILNKILLYVLGVMQKYEKHKLFTNEHISNLKKITICQYINTGLIVFISNYKFQNRFLSIFSNNKYDNILSKQWISGVGLIIIYTILLNIIVSNLGICFLPLLKLFKQLYFKYTLKQTTKIKTFKQYLQLYQKKEVQLHQYYSQTVVAIMVCLTYSYAIPILYPISFVLLITNLSSYKFLMKYIHKKPCYNNNKLNITSCKFIFSCIVLHMFIIWYLQNSKIHQLICITLIIIYFTKQFLLKNLIAFIQRFLGPIFQNLVELLNHEKKMKHINSIFSFTQKQQKMTELQKRKNIIKQQVINSKIYLNETKQFWLKKYLRMLEIEQQKVMNFEPSQNGLIGSISYSKLNLLNVQTSISDDLL